MNLAELLSIPAEMFPDHEVLRFEGQSTTYEALQERVGRTASALRALGVVPGDRIAVLQTNTPAVVEALYASAMVGAVFVPLNFRARSDELQHMVQVARPRLLLAGERYLETAEGLAARDGGLQVAALDSPRVHLPHLPSLASQAEPMRPDEAADLDDDLAVLMFTSGTTAAAKAVMLAHDDLTSFVFNTTEPADGSDRGSSLVAAPLYHIAGLTSVLASGFAGRRIVLMRQFDAAEWLELAGTERVTHAFVVPTMLRWVLDHPRFSATDLAHLQVLSYGAAPMPLSVIRRAIDAFPTAVQFINAFGQTETTSTVTVLGPDDHRLDGTPEEVEQKLRRLGSIGRPLPDVELSIVGESGEPVAPGQVGEIAIRSARTMRGYYQETAATDAAIRDGWLHTRDLGWMDDDGYVFLVGRRSEMIIRGGENIAPEEIELVLESHPAVDEAAVIGVPDDEWGERVVAIVAPSAGERVGLEELAEYCRERLASFKKPELIFFMDALPRNSLGKVLRSELRSRYAGMQGIGGRDGERDE